MEAGKQPHFFTVLIDDFEQKLQIPKAFTKNISEKSSEMAILKGPSGSFWHVKLTRKTTGMYLEDGWGCFSRAHSLSVGQFLVFGYDGNMNFTVQIFDSSTLEEESAFLVINTQEEIECEGSKRRGRPSKAQRRANSCHTSVEPCCLTPNAEHHRRKSVLEQRKPHQPERSKSVKDGNTLLKRGPIQATRTPKREHPFFKVVIRPSYINILPIPTRFSRRYFTKKAEIVTIIVPDGRTWHIRCSKATQGFYQLSEGWNYFKKEMNLNAGSRCVFEMIGDRTFLLNASKKCIA